MKCTAYNGEVRIGEKDFETLQLGTFATPGLLPAQGPSGLTAESGINLADCTKGKSAGTLWTTVSRATDLVVIQAESL
jgi:hypothetical protein